jgi:aldehyde:ferredoxin oxidoreductase
MLEAYYDERGWDERGVPTAETCRALSLEDLVPAATDR